VDLTWLKPTNVTIGRRIGAGYAAVLVLVIAMFVAGAIVLAPLRRDIRDYSDSVLAQADAAGQIALAAKAIGNNGVMGVIGSKNDSSKAVSQMEVKRSGALAVLDKAVANLDGESGGFASARSVELESLRVLIDEYDASVKQALAFRVTNPDRARTVLVDQVMPLGERLDVAAGAYYESERQRAIVEAGRLAGNADAMWMILCAVAGAVVAGSLILSVRIPRTIGRHLQGAAAEIEVGAANMMAIASQVAAGAAQTAAATNQTTATVEEVRQTAVSSQESARQLADNAQDVAQIADASRRQAEGTMGAYARIQEQMDTVAEAIDRLSEQTEAVGGIMTTVSDLAEQSNILSVNASIEAAKAGDQGRGFAVVALEVKTLSEQSKGAVGQVRRILAEIDRAGRSAVQAAEQGRLTIETGSVGVAQAEAGSLTLADAASETAKSASEISASSRQQLAGMEQISQAVGSINVAGDQSVEGAQRVEQEVRRLQELASRLMLLVGSGTNKDRRGWAAISRLHRRNARTRRVQ
jgi:hypothetical protein